MTGTRPLRRRSGMSLGTRADLLRTGGEIGWRQQQVLWTRIRFLPRQAKQQDTVLGNRLGENLRSEGIRGGGGLRPRIQCPSQRLPMETKIPKGVAIVRFEDNGFRASEIRKDPDILEDVDLLREKRSGCRAGVICPDQSMAPLLRFQGGRRQEDPGKSIEIAIDGAYDPRPGVGVTRNLRPGVKAHGVGDEERPSLPVAQFIVGAIRLDLLGDEFIEEPAIRGSAFEVLRKRELDGSLFARRNQRAPCTGQHVRADFVCVLHPGFLVRSKQRGKKDEVKSTLERTGRLGGQGHGRLGRGQQVFLFHRQDGP